MMFAGQAFEAAGLLDNLKSLAVLVSSAPVAVGCERVRVWSVCACAWLYVVVFVCVRERLGVGVRIGVCGHGRVHVCPAWVDVCLMRLYF